MGARKDQGGFTIAEMVVALVVVTVFMTLFFQLYMTNESQRVATVRLAVASDIASTNLRKINVKTALPGTIVCDPAVSGTNPNNQIYNTDPPGTVIPWAGTLVEEDLANTSLPSGTTQELRAIFPRGCDATMPVKIISTVTFGSETVTRAAFIN